MHKGILATTVVVAIAAVAAAVLWRGSDQPASAGAAGPLAYPRGPHGARLLSAEDVRLEVTIFETGVPPHFRVFPYDGSGNPIRPAEVQLTIELHRLGGRVDRMSFAPEADYLLGNGVVEEPHSFDVKVVAARSGRRQEWSYSQVEGKVQLSDAVLKSTGIDIQAVGPRRITSVLDVPGQIVADDTRVARVVPRQSGVVVSVARKVGDPVRRGEVLAVLHSRELAEARSAYLVATHHTEFRAAPPPGKRRCGRRRSRRNRSISPPNGMSRKPRSPRPRRARNSSRSATQPARSRCWPPHRPRRCRATRFAPHSTASCSSAT